MDPKTASSEVELVLRLVNMPTVNIAWSSPSFLFYRDVDKGFMAPAVAHGRRDLQYLGLH